MTNATAHNATETAYIIRNMRKALEKMQKQLDALEMNCEDMPHKWAWSEGAETSADHLCDALSTLEKINLYHGRYS
jgi:hypothetical protein